MVYNTFSFCVYHGKSFPDDQRRGIAAILSLQIHTFASNTCFNVEIIVPKTMTLSHLLLKTIKVFMLHEIIENILIRVEVLIDSRNILFLFW